MNPPRSRPKFYFDKFEDRVPEPPVEHSVFRELLWQYFAVINLVLGAWYITWRWTASLNFDALWFAIPLVLAETCAYIGLCLFTFNLWKVKDYPTEEIPTQISEVMRAVDVAGDRPISIDMFFPSYDEDPELVRLSILDAKAVRYPEELDVKIYVLDDGSRPEMEEVAKQEGIGYITRDGNIGFKAGNMRNAMEQTSGDFIVIGDADTRVFPTILENTLGYFRDPDVAWVQTPQWFFDLPEGKPLPNALAKYLGPLGSGLGKAVQAVFGEVRVGKDPFANDPKLFYDILMRRRNWANASFCCGAGSIHRREAVMQVAMTNYASQVADAVTDIQDELDQGTLDPTLRETLTHQMALETEVTPYKFHVSEDIYTSIILHSDPHREWKSVLHPKVESKMLSPQDLQTWVVQRFKYAGGTLDIGAHDNPVFRPGLTLPQRLMYAMTMWSYLGALWTVLFLVSPAIYFFTGIAPVSAYSMSFFAHILPFLISNEIAMMLGCWGVSGHKGKLTYMATFSMVLRALWKVSRGEEIKFPATPKDRQEGNFVKLTIPQIAVVVISLAGMIYAIARYLTGGDYQLTGILANSFWSLNNISCMVPYILTAFWKPEPDEAEETLAMAA